MRYGARRSSIIGAGTLAMVTLLVGALEYTISEDHYGDERAARFAELRVIGDLKTDQILTWRSERLDDVEVGSGLAFSGVDLAAFVKDPGDATLRAELGARLEALRGDRDFTGQILAAPDGRLLLSLQPAAANPGAANPGAANPAELDPAARGLVAQVVASGEPAMGDFVRVEPSGLVHIDVAAPIDDPSGRPIAVLILRCDPATSLFPLLQTWPTPSESAEILLVRRDDDSILYLNVLRHSAAPALTLRVPLSRTDIPAAQAVLGRTGNVEGPDYRGVSSLADLRSIPGTPWFLVAKVDSAEVAAEVDLDNRLLVALGFLIVLLTGGAIAFGLSLRQSSLQRRLAQAERDRASVALRHQRVLELSRDLFLLLDPSGRIVDANAAALAAYGYSRDELLARTIADLRAPETLPAFEQQWQAAAGPDGVLFETEHRRSDGSPFPVEVSSRGIDIDGVLHRQSFARDITDRRRAEASERRLSTAYATLAATNQAILRAPDEAAVFASICRIAVEHGGYLGAWVGIAEESSKRLVPAASAGPFDDVLAGLSISTDPTRPEGMGQTARAPREGRPAYTDDLFADPTTSPWHDQARSQGVRAFAVLPLLRGGAPVGVLALLAGEPNVFDPDMRALLEEMADDVSFALDGFDRDTARRRSEEALQASRAQLADQLDELRRWSGAMLGREARVLDLKREMNDLLTTLRQPPRYPSAVDDPDGMAPDA